MQQVTRFVALAALLPASVFAQQQPIAVGTPAPPVSLRAATAAGVLPKAFTLDEVKGRTVVLAFFYKARTSG